MFFCFKLGKWSNKIFVWCFCYCELIVSGFVCFDGSYPICVCYKFCCLICIKIFQFHSTACFCRRTCWHHISSIEYCLEFFSGTDFGRNILKVQVLITPACCVCKQINTEFITWMQYGCICDSSHTCFIYRIFVIYIIADISCCIFKNGIDPSVCSHVEISGRICIKCFSIHCFVQCV